MTETNNTNKSGKHFTIALSILIAILFWFYVVNVENPVSDTNISPVPVVLQGEATLSEQGLLVTSTSRNNVTVKAVGKRKSFLKLFHSNLKLYVDVSGIDTAGDYNLTGKIAPDPSKIDASLVLSEKENFTLTVRVEEEAHKDIPIKAEFRGTVAAGYAVEPILLSQTSLRLSGPADVMERVSHAVLVVNGTGLKESIQENLGLVIMDAEGHPINEANLHAETSLIGVQMPVVKLYDVPLNVDIVSDTGFSPADVRLEITPPTLSLSGDASILEGMTELSLGSVNLSEIFNSKTKRFPIVLPEGVKNHGAETEASVTVSIDLPMKSFSVTQIEFQNVPKGFNASLVVDNLQVWVRGVQSDLDALQPNQFRVLVDLSQAQAKSGQQRIEASIVLDATTPVGVVGTDYSVAVNLS